MTYLKVAQKLTKNWATYKRQFVAKNFQKSPILVTLSLVQKLQQVESMES